MTKITTYVGDLNANVPYYSGHTKFKASSYPVPNRGGPEWNTEVFIEYGKIWEVPKGGKIELEWTDDLTALNPDATMNLISEAYE